MLPRTINDLSQAAQIGPRLRHSFATFFLTLSVVVLSTELGSIKVFSSESRAPNIVIILTDDQGIGDVGCYGSEIPTPHIDSLARDGLKFTSWYSASSICTPSRFGLLTGRNPARSRDRLLQALMFLGEEDAGRGIQKQETTVAEVLRGVGYHTALIGKWHLGHGQPAFLPTRHGFDLFRGHTGGCIDYHTMTYGNLRDWYHGEEHVDRDGYATDLITDEAVNYLKSRREESSPFFLYLAYNAPHFGKGWSPGESKTVNIMQPKAADLKRVAGIKDKVRREFAAMTVSLDDGIGRVLAALKQNGMEKETLVVFMTDHGGDPVYGGDNGAFRAGKATLFEGGIRVPCLMRWPGKIKPGSQTDQVAWALDLFPTFCQFAKADVSKLKLDGKDVSSLIVTGTPVEERDLYWELGQHRELERGRWTALRRGDWKYVEDAEGAEFLFDMKTDPHEKKNLLQSQSSVAKQLRDRRDELAVEYAK